MRQPEGLMRALEARFSAIEQDLLEHRFALDGRLSEVERHFEDLERRLASARGGQRAAPEGAVMAFGPAPEKWEEDDDMVDSLCGFLADDSNGGYMAGKPPLSAGTPQDMSRQQLGEVTDEQSYYEVKSSCWDACVFIGTSFLPNHTNVGLFLSTLVNVGIQTLFSGIIWWYFKEPTYDSELVESVRDWRYHAQTYRMADATTRASLASRVCKGDTTLSYATDKAVWAQELQGWLQGSNLLLCVLAIFLWGLTIFEEAFDAVQFLTSVICLPWGNATHIGISEGKLELRAISRSRAVLALSVAFVRLGIAGVLLYVGSVWLINTDSPDDLILNAVALNFLLQCDELVYSVFCPPTARALIQALEPIPLKKRHRLPLHMVVGAAWVLLPAFIFWLARKQLMPYQELKAEVMEALCGGLTHFVFDTDALGRVMYAATPGNHEPPTALDTHRSLVVQSIIRNSSRDAISAIRMDLDELAETKKMSRAMITKFWKCADNPADLRYAYGAIGVGTLETCMDAEKYCLGEAYSFVRAVCPQTCGCADPLSGLVQYRHGCPRNCFTSRERTTILRQLPCVDRSLAWLNATIGWQNFLTELPRMLVVDWDYSLAWISRHLQLLRRLGCAALANPEVLEIGVTILCGPMAGFCPVACKCSTMQTEDAGWFCPTQCAAPGLPVGGQLAQP